MLIGAELGYILGALFGMASICYGGNLLVNKFFNRNDLHQRILIVIATLLLFCFISTFMNFRRVESGNYILDSLIHYFIAAVAMYFFFALRFRKKQLIAAFFYAIIIFFLSLLILVPFLSGRGIIVNGTVGDILCLFALLIGGGLSGFLVMEQKLPFTKREDTTYDEIRKLNKTINHSESTWFFIAFAICNFFIGLALLPNNPFGVCFLLIAVLSGYRAWNLLNKAQKHIK